MRDSAVAEVAKSTSPSSSASALGPDAPVFDDGLKEKAVVEPALENEDGVEYPQSWKLGLITLALCFSVFCVALVRLRLPNCFYRPGI